MLKSAMPIVIMVTGSISTYTRLFFIWIQGLQYVRFVHRDSSSLEFHKEIGTITSWNEGSGHCQPYDPQ